MPVRTFLRTSTPPDPSDTSREPRRLDDLDAHGRIYAPGIRLRALWGVSPWWFESTRAHVGAAAIDHRGRVFGSHQGSAKAGRKIRTVEATPRSRPAAAGASEGSQPAACCWLPRTPAPRSPRCSDRVPVGPPRFPRPLPYQDRSSQNEPRRYPPRRHSARRSSRPQASAVATRSQSAPQEGLRHRDARMRSRDDQRRPASEPGPCCACAPGGLPAMPTRHLGARSRAVAPCRVREASSEHRWGLSAQAGRLATAPVASNVLTARLHEALSPTPVTNL
jgi:hypothetical protein